MIRLWDSFREFLLVVLRAKGTFRFAMFLEFDTIVGGILVLLETVSRARQRLNIAGWSVKVD